MKQPSFLAFLTILGVRGQQQDEYLGYNVTTASDGDFALCGTNLWGCVSLPPNARGCNVKAQLGTFDELGTPSQQWMYKDGLLKPKVQPSRWYSTGGRDVCLGPKGAEELELGRSYPLTLQYCPNDEDGEDEDGTRHMRFIMVDGRMQSLAPVVIVPPSGDGTDTEEINMTTTTTPYCMSIGGNVVMQSAGSAITLEPCNPQNMLQQGLQSFGTVQPFVYSLQDVWGYSDVVELAFAVGHSVLDDEPVVTVTIYNQHEEKVHSLQGTTASGILSFNVSDLMGVEDTPTSTGEYIATLKFKSMEDSVAFSVTDESHVRYTCSTKPSSSSGLLMAMAILGLIAGMMLCTVHCYSCAHHKQTGMEEEEKTVVVKMDDDDDDESLFETRKDKDNDDAETLSQATTSSGSNDETELVSDQA